MIELFGGNMVITPERVVLLITFFINLSIALFVFFKNPRRKVNIVFGLLMFFVACWNITNFLSDSIKVYEISLAIGYWTLGSAIFIPSLFLYFALIFPKEIKLKKWQILLIFLPGFILLPFIPTKYNIVPGTFRLEAWGTYFESGILYNINTIYVLIFFIIAFFLLLRSYLKAKSKIIKIQLLYIIIGFFISATIGVVTNAILPTLGNHRWAIYGTPCSIVLGLCVAYAITRYRFMDIKLAIKKGTAHLVSIAVILAVYTGVILAGQQILIQKYNWEQTLTTVLAVLVIALSVEPLRRLVIKGVNHLLYTKKEKKRVRNKEQAKRHAHKLIITQKASAQVEDVVSKIMVHYLHFISPEKIKLLLYDQDSKQFECSYPKDQDLSLEVDSPLYSYLRQNPEILVTQEIPYLLEEEDILDKRSLRDAEKFLKKNKAEIAVPIGDESHVWGLFLLGRKIDGEVYTKEDIENLNDFRGSCTPVLVNVIRYKQAVEGIRV